MFKYDKSYISKRASEFGFARDTLEKVYRLADILEFLNTEPNLKGKLVLKGGTAINLTIFNLPRLSVDIDLVRGQRQSRIDVFLKIQGCESRMDVRVKNLKNRLTKYTS